jgi:hypothetical protein
MNSWNLFDTCDWFRGHDSVDYVVTDRASWAVSASDLLVDLELLLVDRGVAGPLEQVNRFHLFAPVVPDDDVFSKGCLDCVNKWI